jgi:hypothetical protein
LDALGIGGDLSWHVDANSPLWQCDTRRASSRKCAGRERSRLQSSGRHMRPWIAYRVWSPARLVRWRRSAAPLNACAPEQIACAVPRIGLRMPLSNVANQGLVTYLFLRDATDQVGAEPELHGNRA